jgi:Holliday junction resolvase RusA-like endonuclease
VVIKVSENKMQQLIIKGRLPGLNEIIAMSKKGKRGYQPYQTAKKEITEMILWECKAQMIMPCAIRSTVNVKIEWHCKNKRRDKDNVMVGQKFILDALQHAGIIRNDGWKEIGKIEHTFLIKPEEQIIITMEEETL